MGFLKSFSKIGLLPAVKIGNVLTAGLEKVTGKTYGRQTTERFASTKAGLVLGTATAGTAVALASVINPVATRAVERGTVKVLKPKSISGALALGSVGYLAVKSKKTRKIITSAPAVYVKALDTTADIIEGDKKITPENIGQLAKVAGVVTGTGALAVGAGLVVKKILDKKETPATTLGGGVVPSIVSAQPSITPTPPITPETVSLSEITPPKTATQPRGQTIKQTVKVMVNQKNTNRGKSVRYLSHIYN